MQSSRSFVSRISTWISSFISRLPESQNKIYLRWQRQFPSQLWTLLRYQVSSDLEDSITIYRLMETVGIGILAGLVWFQKGSVDTQTALGESIGLFFFSTALYAVPPVFQVLVIAPSTAKRVSCEHLSGMYPIHTYVVSMTLSSFFTVAIWAPVWQMIAYTFADLGGDPGSMLRMQLTLALNVIAMRAMGYSLAMMIPDGALNVVIANMFVQMCMLTTGFYTKLPSWLQWVTVVSVPRYTFRALLQIEYSWRDTFEVHPMHGLAGFGNPSRYIPAELTGTFQLMTERQMNVLASPHDPSPWNEMLVLAGISVAFLLVFLVALQRHVWTLEDLPPKYSVVSTSTAAEGDASNAEEKLSSSDSGPTLLTRARERWGDGKDCSMAPGADAYPSTKISL